MTAAQAGPPDFDLDVEEDPVLYVADDGPDGPEELLRLVPAELPVNGTVDEGVETSARGDETSQSSRALPG
jgi:hypothetical protein